MSKELSKEVGFKEDNKKTPKEVVEFIKKEGIKVVDAVFTDPYGLWQHCTFTGLFFWLFLLIFLLANQLDENGFVEGDFSLFEE